MRWAKWVTGKKRSVGQFNMAGRNAEYWETLERLPDSKMQVDYEETLQDDFADHREDIKNFVSSNNARIMAPIMARLAEIENEISSINIKLNPFGAVGRFIDLFTNRPLCFI